MILCLAFGQDKPAETEPPRAFPPDWWQVWDYNLLRWSFLAATLMASFGLGTMAFSNALNSGRPSRAGCIGWMVWGLAFIALWVLIFAVLIPTYTFPDWITWVMLGIALLILAIVVLRLTRRS
ncbi:MAG TPA: hypothetical protein VGE01_02105 [Fimbriimonas sp.]